MRNRTYVCFDCRTTERVPLGRIARNCRKCRAQAEHVYYKFKLPRRDDDAGWQSLLSIVRAFNRQAKANVLARLRQQRTKLERRLAELPESKEAARRTLRFKLKVVSKEIGEWNLW